MTFLRKLWNDDQVWLKLGEILRQFVSVGSLNTYKFTHLPGFSSNITSGKLLPTLHTTSKVESVINVCDLASKEPVVRCANAWILRHNRILPTIAHPGVCVQMSGSRDAIGYCKQLHRSLRANAWFLRRNRILRNVAYAFMYKSLNPVWRNWVLRTIA